MAKKRFLEGETEFHGEYKLNVFETLYFTYKKYIGKIVFYFVAGVLGRILVMGNANLIGIWVDSFCRDPNECKPIPHIFENFSNVDFLASLSTLAFFGFVLTAVFRIGFSRNSARAVSLLHDEVVLRVSRYPIQFFDTTPAGRIITRFSSDYGNIFRIFVGPMAEILALVFDLIAMFLLIGLASPYYFPIFVLVALGNYVIYRFNRKSLRRERRLLSKNRSPSIAHFAETAQGATSVRIFSRQNSFQARFSKLNNLFLNQKLRTTTYFQAFSLQMNFATSVLLLGTGLGGYWLVQNGLASVGSVGVAFSFVLMAGGHLQLFFEWMAQLEEAMTGMERLDEYLRRPIETGLFLPSQVEFATDHPKYEASVEEQIKRGPQFEKSAADVKFQDVWFRYGHDLPYVLKGINLHIEAGEKIGIVGKTGSGKTSLIQALFRLYPVEKGKITIADLDLDLTSFRKLVSYIPQDPSFFRGTLRENLDLEGQRSNDDLFRALELVGSSGGLRQDLSMVVEEKGRNLSTGERQLLCVARCLLMKAPVVVMDEATSSVDPQSEEILIRATRQFFKDRTQIIVAHRLSTIEHCDRVLWMENGEVKELGPTARVLSNFKMTHRDSLQ